ncbi:MAG: GFA family protein [Candidatus Tectomicrobia bacterium]
MEISGGCFCGSIEYKASLDEAHVGICHCRDCQIFSGSAFRMTSWVAPENFEFTIGVPKYFDKKADSGKVRRMAFCGECGTHLCSVPVDPEETGGFISLRLAPARGFDQFKPAIEIFCSSRVPWLSPLEGVAQFAGMPGGAEAP